MQTQNKEISTMSKDELRQELQMYRTLEATKQLIILPCPLGTDVWKNVQRTYDFDDRKYWITIRIIHASENEQNSLFISEQSRTSQTNPKIERNQVMPRNIYEILNRFHQTFPYKPKRISLAFVDECYIYLSVHYDRHEDVPMTEEQKNWNNDPREFYPDEHLICKITVRHNPSNGEPEFLFRPKDLFINPFCMYDCRMATDFQNARDAHFGSHIAARHKTKPIHLSTKLLKQAYAEVQTSCHAHVDTIQMQLDTLHDFEKLKETVQHLHVLMNTLQLLQQELQMRNAIP